MCHAADSVEKYLINRLSELLIINRLRDLLLISNL